MPKDIKNRITNELDRRIKLIDGHLEEELHGTGNQFEELNMVMSRMIGASLKKELQSIRSYVEEL